MDGYGGVARLEWWASAEVCVARVPVVVHGQVRDGIWSAAVSPPLEPPAEEELRFLIDADPVCLLRFADGSMTDVVVEHPGDLARLTLSAFPRRR
jgi:hypothetical protein